MKHISIFVVSFFIAALMISCNDQPPTNPTLNKFGDDILEKSGRNFVATLSGDEEVPPAETAGRGQAIFRLSQDGQSLQYKLIVANIENITMAHIHLAPAGVNGPVVVWLYPSGPPPILIPGRFNGILAEGTITAANLVGTLAGQPLSALLDEMNSGNAYVNVHTSSFPAGEIRGQIR